MDGMIKLNDIVGVFVLFATMAILLLAAVITFIIFIYEAKNSTAKSEQKWSKHFLFSAILFLLFDGAFFLLVISNKTWTSDEGAVFDERMLFIWIPCHIVGYFFTAYILCSVQKNQVKINGHIDKLRQKHKFYS